MNLSLKSFDCLALKYGERSFQKKSVVSIFFFFFLWFMLSENNSKSNQLHFNNLKEKEIIKIYVYKIGDTSFN